MVHSEADYNAAVEASGILFGNATSEALKKLDEDTLLSVFEGVPQFEVAKSDIEAGIKAVDLFTEKAAIFPSKGEMRKLVQGGGVSLNKENWLHLTRKLPQPTCWMKNTCSYSAERKTIIW